MYKTVPIIFLWEVDNHSIERGALEPFFLGVINVNVCLLLDSLDEI